MFIIFFLFDSVTGMNGSILSAVSLNVIIDNLSITPRKLSNVLIVCLRFYKDYPFILRLISKMQSKSTAVL